MNGENVRIQEAAYYLWESEGRPAGQEARHWELAQQMLSADEKPRRKTRNKTDQAAKALTSGVKKAPVRKKSMK